MRKIIINTLAIFVTISLHTHAQKRGEVPTFQWGTTGKQIDLSWAAEVGSRVEDNQSTNTFKVKDFGAQNDSNYLSTQAIQKAIDACSNAGGGKVLFEPGYYQTGALFVKKVFTYTLAPEPLYWQAQTSISIPNSGLELQVSKWYGHRL